MGRKPFVIVIGLLIFISGIVFSEAHMTKSVDAALRELWMKSGTNIFPANPNWSVGIGTSTPQQKLEVDGGIRMNTGTAKPACDSQAAGTLWVESSPSGNSLEFCKAVSVSGNDIINIQNATLSPVRSALSCAEDSSTNKIYCFGGSDSGGGFLDQIVEYDPTNDILTNMGATLPSSRRSLACAENSATHLIYCFGGENPTIFSDTLEYNPANDIIVTKNASLSPGRYAFSCVENSATHKIYCLGGVGPSYLDQIVEYDPVTDTINDTTAKLPYGRKWPACAEDSSTNKIYCFGGTNASGPIDQIVEYDPATNSVTEMNAKLVPGREGPSCAENSATNLIYCFGGGSLDEIVEYDSTADAIKNMTATLPSGRYAHSCEENSATHKIYCFGGYDGTYIGQIVEFISFAAPQFQWVQVA